MKKPDEVRKIAYQLRIKDIHGVNWVYPIYFRSLQLAVEEAARYVFDIDHYKKIYRRFKAMNGFYISSFFSIPTEAKPEQLLIVEITSYEHLPPQEIEAALAHLARTQKGQKGR